MTKVYDIIRAAADEYLWDGVSSFDVKEKVSYSCVAVFRALLKRGYNGACLDSWIKSFGCNPNRAGFSEFRNEDIQPARYAWLMLLADIAEEEGFEV